MKLGEENIGFVGELDEVFEKVVENLEENSLLLVCGSFLLISRVKVLILS